MKREKHIQVDEWIALYQDGNIDRDSLKKLTQWASASDENRVYVRSRLEVWFSAGVSADTTNFNKELAFGRFKQHVKDSRQPQDRKIAFIPFKLWRTVVRVAAIIAIILLPFAGYWQSQKDMQRNFADISIEAPMGSRTKLYLPDGTLVWLNSGSRIVYSQGFGIDNRSLTMEGEGYFEVVSNPKLPFTVQTKELGLQVLGTKFNFRNYIDDSEVVVNLLEGKVCLNNKVNSSPAFYLSPDEKMVMNKHTGKMVKSRSKTHLSNVWVDDELFFDEILLTDIVRSLVRSYGVKIVVAEGLEKERFYGSFTHSEYTIEQILSTIASTKHLHYKYENGVYYLY